MRRVTRGLIGAAALATIGATALQAPAAATPAASEAKQTVAEGASSAGAPPDATPNQTEPSHGELPNPLADERDARRKEALEKVIRGQAKVMSSEADSDVVKLADGKYAEMSFERVDQVFTILGEFGDQIDPRTAYKEPGPLHNEIPEPVSSRDNSTIWQQDFDRQSYLDLLFGDSEETFRHYYETQSNGVYSVDGDVSDWTELPFNGARYGSNDIPSNDGYWAFVQDAADKWYQDQLDAGMTKDEIVEYLSRFDERDRYDFNGDGNFSESDGYLDNFQLVFAGEGEEAGGGTLGADAIWSHRWYAFVNLIGQAGPEGNLRGGAQIGDTGLWIGDYTVQPENGGLGVFAHEFGHNLGLPDLYDTAGGENGTAFWTVMSSGSWLGHGKGTIGSTPNGFDAWSKLQLGWLNYSVASPNRESTHTIGVSEQTDVPQAVVVPLPKEEVVTEYNTPFSGTGEWWSGSADDLNSRLARPVDLTGASESAALSGKLWYDIEEGYDFLFAEVSTNGGESWETLGEPITGTSDEQWTDYELDLSDHVGQEILVQFRYTTDGGVHHAGAMFDDLAVTADGEQVFFDDVESGVGEWEAIGWEIFGGSTSEFKGTYYIAENRQYAGYDSTLETGPYNFGRARTRPNWVDHFPYQNGVLIWQWDERYEDNQTSVHPGAGEILPIDARPTALRWDDGALVRNRLQSFDATFGAESTDPLAVSMEKQQDGRTQIAFLDVPVQDPVTVFDDSDPKRYWDPDNPRNSAKVAGYGVSIKVVDQSTDGLEQTLVVAPSDAG